SGDRKALLIGINYPNSSGPLKGCINDVRNAQQNILPVYGYQQHEIRVMTDDLDPSSPDYPSRANILAAMRWLVEDAEHSSVRTIWFSGHGGPEEDLDGDEDDGNDEAICPADYETAGTIIDDDMNRILVQSLPPGARLTAIFDCCHSGSALDLPLLYNATGQLKKSNRVAYKKDGTYDAEGDQRKGNKHADVVFLSGCMDTQTSSDVPIGNSGIGALTRAFTEVLEASGHEISYGQLLEGIRDMLKAGSFEQVPQLSAARKIRLDEIY
ncbi:peptidase C14, partial [Ramicandelaber brevisporus]